MKARLKKQIQHHPEGTAFHYAKGVFISGSTAFMVEDIMTDAGESFHLEEVGEIRNLQTEPEDNFYESLLNVLSPQALGKLYTA